MARESCQKKKNGTQLINKSSFIHEGHASGEF